MIRYCVLVMAFVCLLPPAAATRAQSPEAPGFEPGRYGLDATPLVNEKLGVTMYYPKGAEVTSMIYGEGAMATLVDAADPPRWRMQIQQMVMRGLPEPSPKGVSDQLVTSLRRGGQELEILVNEPRQLGDRPAHYLVVDQEGMLGGFMIAGTGDDRYLIFRILDMVREDWEELRQVFDASFATVRLTTTQELKKKREQQLDRAKAFLAALTPERLKSVVGKDRWYRLYQPDPDGNEMKDVEIGYLRMTVEEGPGDSVKTGQEITTGGQNERGLLVTIRARYLESIERGRFADVEARMWQSWDRSDESWSIRITRRQQGHSVTEGEFAIRTSELGYSKLEVVKSTLETRNRDAQSWVVEEPYLSRPEVYLMGALLPRDGSITGTMAFHSYEPSIPGGKQLPIRLDTWRPADDGSGEWVLESRPVPDVPPVVSRYDREGNLIRRLKGDGTVTEPIELRRLFDIWRSKGLPTSTDGAD